MISLELGFLWFPLSIAVFSVAFTHLQGGSPHMVQGDLLQTQGAHSVLSESQRVQQDRRTFHFIL